MKPKILQVCFSRSWGGLEMYPLVLSRALRERGNDVSVLAPPGSPLAREILQRGDIPLFTISGIKYIDLSAIYRIARLISKQGINIVHLHHSSDLWLVVPASLLSTGPGLLFTSQMSSVYNKKDLFHRFLYRHIDLAIAITEDGRRKMLQSCPLPPDRTLTLHYGVDLNRFNPSLYNREKERIRFGLDGKERVVGLLGRIDPWKGQKEFLLASEKVLAVLPDIKFVIAGQSDRENKEYEQELRGLVQKRGMGEKVIFTGFIKDTPSFLSCLDLFVMPSYHEAFGMVLIEAMAMGIPVIGTKAGGVPEIIEDGQNGLLVPPREVDSLAEAMKKLLFSKILSMDLARRGREKVKERFSLSLHTERIEEIYDLLLRER